MFNLFQKSKRPKVITVDETVFDNLLDDLLANKDVNLLESLVVPVTMFEQYLEGYIFDIVSEKFNLNGEIYAEFIRNLFFSYNDFREKLFSTKNINEQKVNEILSIIAKNSILCDVITHTSNIMSFIHLQESTEDNEEEALLVLARQRNFLIEKKIYNRNIKEVDIQKYFLIIKEFLRKFSPKSIKWHSQ